MAINPPLYIGPRPRGGVRADGMVAIRDARAVLLVVLAVQPAGCLPARPDADAAATARRVALVPPAGVIRMDVAVIERPAGDTYLNRSLWELADEQAVDLEHKPALDDNGFRVGLIGGLLPADLLALLTSERTCADPHRVQTRVGGTCPVSVGAPRPLCRFTLRQDGAAVPVELTDAACLLEIVPTPVEGGRTTLRFTPVVRHGNSRREPKAVRDPSGEHRWDLEVQQPSETYAAVSWEVSVKADEYVVVGTRLDGAETLGRSFFLDGGRSPPVQRLLVVRAGQALPGAAPSDALTGRAPPLALQAAWRTARGASPGGIFP